MGTRHMIGVIKNGTYKVGQYGQWDGYPEGQGYDLLNILRCIDMNELKEKVDYCVWITQEKLRQYYIDAGDSPDNERGWITMEVANRFNEEHPQFSRDNGAKIINFVMNASKENPLELVDGSDFLKDEISCEFAYVIDFDKNQLICYTDADKHIYATYDLYNLPQNETLKEDYDKWYKKEYPEDVEDEEDETPVDKETYLNTISKGTEISYYRVNGCSLNRERGTVSEVCDMHFVVLNKKNETVIVPKEHVSVPS